MFCMKALKQNFSADCVDATFSAPLQFLSFHSFVSDFFWSRFKETEGLRSFYYFFAT